MDFKSSLTSQFIQTATVFKNLLEKKLEVIGLHSGQIFILITLWESDGQSQNELAVKLRVSPPTINKMVKSLVRGKFVTCTKCTADGRIMRVSLTEKAVLIRPEIERIWIESEEIFQANLTEPEKLIFKQLMEKSSQNLLS